MPGNGFEGGPKQAKVGPKHIKAGPPTRGRAGSDRQGRAGDPRRSPLPAGHTPRRRTGRRLRERRRALGADSGHGVPRPGNLDRLRPRQRPLVRGTGPGARPNRLPHPDRNVGRRHDLSPRGDTTSVRVRIVGEIFDTHNRGLNLVTNWATLRTTRSPVSPPTSSTSASDLERRPTPTRTLSTAGSAPTTSSN